MLEDLGMFIDIVTVIVILTVILFFLIVLPIKKEVAVEGLFEGARYDRAYDGTKYRLFEFRQYCKECMEKWRNAGEEPRNFNNTCTSTVPRKAKDIGTHSYQKGDVVKLIVWKNIFGTIKKYKVESSDFEYIDYYDYKKQLEAKKAGFENVDEHRKFLQKEYREKKWQGMIEKHNLSRDEAMIFEPLVMPDDTEVKRRGINIFELKTIQKKELYECIYNKDVQSALCDEIRYGDELYDRFQKENEIPQNILEHLNVCAQCNYMFLRHFSTEAEVRQRFNLRTTNEIRDEQNARRLNITVLEYQKQYNENWILIHGGENCISLKERAQYAKGAELTMERQEHINTCIGCKRMIIADRADFLATGQIGGLTYQAYEKSRQTVKPTKK